MIRKKSICLFLLMLIALMCCSAISAADTGDTNTTTTVNNHVKITDNQISEIKTTNSDDNGVKVNVQEKTKQRQETSTTTSSSKTIKNTETQSNNKTIEETDDNKIESRNINTNTNKAKDLTSTKTLKTANTGTAVSSGSQLTGSGTYYLTQNITISSPISVTGNFVLDGNGFTINGQGTSAFISSTGSNVVNINNVILKNMNGVVVNVGENVTMTNVAFVDCTSSSNLIYSHNRGTLYLTNVLFENNTCSSELIYAHTQTTTYLTAVSFVNNNKEKTELISQQNNQKLYVTNVYYISEHGEPGIITNVKDIQSKPNTDVEDLSKTFNSEINITNDTVFLGETGKLIITLSCDGGFNIPYGEVTYTIDGKEYTNKTGFDSRIIVPIEATNIKVKTLTATYPGLTISDRVFYTAVTAEGELDVLKLTTSITTATTVEGKANTEVTIPVTVKDMHDNPVNEGTVVLKSGDDIITRIDLSETNEIKYTPTKAGENTYTIEYLGTDDKYNTSNVDITLNIERQEAKISSQDVNGYVQQELTIPVTVTDESGNAVTEGTVDLIQDGQIIKTIDLSSETITITPQQEGTTQYRLRYNQNDIYTESTADINVVVSKRDTETKASVLNNTVENVTIDVTVTDTSVSNDVVDMGTVVITNGETEVGRGTVSNGKATIKTEIAEINQYDLKVTYLGNDKYTTSSDDTSLANLDVVGKTAGISGLSDGNKIGHSSVVVTLTDAETGEAISGEHITVLNGQNTVTTSDDVTDSEGKLTIPLNLGAGSYTLTVRFDGNTKYAAVSDDVPITIGKHATSTSAVVDNSTVGNLLINVAVTDEDYTSEVVGNGTVEIVNTDDNNRVVGTGEIVNGEVTINVTDISSKGTYNLQANYLGNDYYYNSDDSQSTNNIKNTEVIGKVSDVTGTVTSDVIGKTGVKITLVDSETGTSLNGETVTVKEGDTTLGSGTITDGEVTLPVDLTAGEHTLTISYDGNNIYAGDSDTVTIDVTKRNTTTTATVTNNTAENIIIDVTVTDTNYKDEVVSKGTVNIMNGETVVGTGEIVNGKATITTNIGTIGTYNLVAQYTENDYYLASDDSQSDDGLDNTVVVGKVSDITAAEKGNIIGHSSVDVTLVDSETGNAISEAPVTVSENGVEIATGTTDSEGNVNIPVELTSGSHDLTVTYTGNSVYAGDSDPVTINVVKRGTSTTATVTNNTAGNVVVDVTVTDTSVSDERVANGTVNIINTATGLTVGSGVVVDGKVTITTDIATIGTYNLETRYIGNDYYNPSSDKDSDTNIANTEVVGKVSDINGEVTNNIIGKSTVKVTLVDVETGTSLNGEEVTIYEGENNLGSGTITDGEITIPVSLSAGSHDLIVEYTGNNVYAGDSDPVTINVVKRGTSTTATVTNNTAGNVVVDVTVTDTSVSDEPVANGTVNIMLNGESVGTSEIVEGKVTIITNIGTIGTYNLKVVYDENDYYLGSNDADSLSDLDVIGKVSSISGKITSNIIGKTGVEVTLIDPETNTPISDATIKVKLPDGTIITGQETTNSEGKIVIPVDIPAGENILNISFDGNTVYAGSSQNVPANVVKRNTTTTATAVNTTAGNVLIDVTVTDATTGETVTNGSVEIKNGDEVVGIGTITDGKVTINATGITIKDTYNLIANYTGNDYYYNSSDVNSLANLEVVGKDSYITANVTGDTSEDTKVNVKLVDPETNNPLSDADIIVTLPDGTNITGKTNGTGEVSIPVDIPVGDNTLNVTYPGNETYNGSNTTVDVDVNKLPSTTIANVANNIVSNVIVNVKVTDKTTGEIITSGNINITVGDTVVGRGVLTGDGTAIITTSITEKGTYDLVVNYEGNDKYTESSYSLNDVTVVGKTSEIKVNVTNKTVGNTTVNITLVDPDDNTPIPDADITVTLPNGTEINRTTDENGTVIVPVDIPVGPNDINITYSGNETYNGTNTTVNIDVNKRPSTTTATITNNTAANVVVDVKVTDTVTGTPVTSGNVNITVDDIVVGRGVLTGDGTAIITTSITEKGTYNFVVNYEGNTNYTESSTTLNDITVVAKQSDITATVENSTLGNTSIDVKLVDPETNTPISDADIIVTLPNGTNITGKTNKTGEVNIPVDIPVGDSTLNVTYPGDNTYNKTNTTVDINVEKLPSTITADVVSTAGNIVVNVKVTDKTTGKIITNGNVNITVDDIVVGRGVLTGDGTAIITTSITEKGTYDLVVNYEGNTNYTESSTTLNDVTVVGRTSEIKVNVTNKTVGNTTVNITLVDPDDDTPIPDANITVTLPNGTEINRTTDENGTVIVPVDIPVGSNDINITYSGNETYNGTNTTVNIDVNKRPSTTTATVTDNVATRVTVDVKVTDTVTGTPVTSGNVNIALPNGTVVGRGVLTEDGTVAILTTITEKGTYNLTINYEGNINYTESSTTLNDVTVVGKESKITVNITNDTVGNTTVNITLVDPDDDTPIPDANITVTLPNGTKVNGTTNENGTVEIPVDIPVGPSDINITYPGNETYNGTNTTVPVDISKRPSSTSATLANATAGNVVVDVKVTDAVTDASVTSGNVYISTADGAIIGTGVLTNDGTATITTSITNIGTYDLVVTFEGNENYTESDTALSDITVSGKTSGITAAVTNNTLGNTSVDVTLVDPETDTPISNAEIIITLPDGTNVTGTTNTTGGVIIPVDIPVGDNTLNVTYNGDNAYAGSNTTVDVNVAKRPSSTTATLANGTATNSLVYVKVVDAITGNIVTSGNININLINGTRIGMGKVSSNGTATIKIGIENTGTYNLVVEYLGNANYTESSTALNDLTITGKESSIIATVENETYGNTTVDVTLVDPETDEPIGNATVIVTLPNGTEVNGTTNSNGHASIPVDIPVGDNTLNVTYPGDNVYNGTNTTVNVNVAKRPSSTSATIVNTTAGNVVVDVKVTDAVTDASVTSGNIYISTADGAIIGTGVLSNDGTASITTSITDIGIYDLVVYFEGNTNYTESDTALSDITVSGKISDITAAVTNNTLGNTSVDVTLVDPETDTPISNAEIIITLPDGTNVTGTTNTTGEVTVPVNIPVGDNTLNVTYLGDKVYSGSDAAVDVNVAKRPSSTTATIANATAGNVVVDVKVTDAVTGKTVTSGNVDIKLADGTLVGRGKLTSDGTVSITTTIANIGLYDLVVSYLGNDNYTESETALNSITVTGKESSITADVENKTYGNTTVDVTLVDPETDTPISNATVIVTLPNGTKVNGTTNSNGHASIPVDIPVGDNTLNVTYPGDDVYNGTNTTVDVNVAKRPSTTTATIVNNTAANVTVSVKVTDSVTDVPVTSGNVNISVDGVVVGTGVLKEDGTVIIKTSIITKGTYDFAVSYEGNTNYTESSTTLSDITVVGKESKIIVNITNDTVGNTTVNITIVDPDDDTPVPDANITVTLPNGTKVNGTTDENGTVEIPVDIPVGPNDINITYPGNETYNGTNTTVPVDVNKRSSTTSAGVINNIASNVTVDVKVVDTVTGTPVTSGYVNITLPDGNIVGRGELSGNGTVEILTTITEKGTYNLTVNYEGNENYTESSDKLDDITVVGRNSNITVTPGNTTVGNTTVNVTIVDPDTNETIPNATVIVTLPNGTDVNGTTDENGTVEIPVDIPVGDNNITITYPGNETYNGTNTTVDVNVHKVATIVTVTPFNGIIGEKITLVAHVTDIYGNPVDGGCVVLKLNGKTLRVDGSFNSTAESMKFNVTNGTVTYTLTADVYLKHIKDFRATYSGSDIYKYNRSDVVDVQLNKRNAEVTVTTNTTNALQDTDITFTANLRDITPDIENTTAIDTGFVLFKVNGKTLRDENNSDIHVQVVNSTATYTYHVPRGMASTYSNGTIRDYNVSTLYLSKAFNNETRNSTTFNVEKAPVNISIENMELNNTSRVLTVTANITDYNNNLAAGCSKVSIAVNGETLLNANNETLIYSVHDGKISLTYKIPGRFTNITSIELVSNENNAYLRGSNTTNQVTIV